jgi:hypothetical protein
MIRSAAFFGLARGDVQPGAQESALTRAVSTLYYALFHRLLESARALVRHGSASVQQGFVASFQHEKLKVAAQQSLAAADKTLRKRMLKGGALDPWTELFPVDPSDDGQRQLTSDLQRVCNTFVKMQGLRHQADDHAEWGVTFTEADEYCRETEAALAAWDRIERTDEGLIFLLAGLGVLTIRK